MKITPQQLKLGGFTVYWLRGGTFFIDGGAMFGSVPKVLWSKKLNARDDNTIGLDNNVMLVQTGKNNVIIDTGLGNKLTEKQQEIYEMSSPWLLHDDLEACGLTANDIDTVILTHCDFDHAGGALMLDTNKDEVPSFPNAQYIIQKDEWHDVHNTTKRSASTYWPINFAALPEDQVVLVEGGQEIVPGINVVQTGGHTKGHQIVEIKSEGALAVHLGDLLPTTHHAKPLWVMAFDNYPLEAIAAKERFIPHYSCQNAWFLMYHDTACHACRLSDQYQVTDLL
jgi:glyoxylase-like metal-dependent hydrolase (beta-lactamase superfamily II)